MKVKSFLMCLFAVFVFAGTSLAGTEEVIYDSGDVQKAAYGGGLDITVNYTDANITDPATKIVLTSSLESANMNDGTGQPLDWSNRFSVDIYGDGSGTDMRFNFYVYPYDGSRFYKGVTIDFTGWQTVSVDLADMTWFSPTGLTQEEALDGEVGIFQLQGPWGSTPGTIYIDNAKLIIGSLTYDLDENLFQNGDAEASIDFQNWYKGGYPDYAYESYTDSATYGSECFVFDNTSDVFQTPSMRSLAVPTEANEPYLLKFWYKTLPGFNMIDPQGIRADFRTWTTGYGTYLGGTNFELPVTDGNWVQVEQEVVTPNEPNIAQLDVRFSLNVFGDADGVVQFDEIELYDTHCPLVGVQELIDNGGFETGDLTSYPTNQNATVINTDSSEGSYSVQFDANVVSYIITKNYSVSDVDDILYSCDMKTPAGVTPTASFVNIRFYDTDTASWLPTLTAVANPDTGGVWETFSGEHAVPEEADLMNVFIRWEEDSEVALFDNLSIKSAVSSTCEESYDLTDLSALAFEWLDEDFLPLEPDILVDDFEGYASEAELDAAWMSTSGSYANRGTCDQTLITDPCNAHTGSQALEWAYDNNGAEQRSWTEFHTTFSQGVDFGKYDEIHIWLNRHPGNSEEELLYFKFYNGTVDTSNIQAAYELSAADGSSYSPTGWTEWVVDLNECNFLNGATEKADLDNVVGMFFGVVGDDTTQGKGSGVIDFDDIYFVDSVPGCGTAPDWDLNGDCEVNFEDVAVMAESWVNN